VYFSHEIIKRAYKNLINLDSSTGKSRMEKVSGLRHLLAASQLLLQESAHEFSLAVGSDLRKKFVEAVGRIVALNANGLYTKDFASSFEFNDDYAVGSNFFTTRLVTSRSQDTVYPRRPAPLLVLKQETVSIIDNVEDVLQRSYGLAHIKAELSIWLLRANYFKIDSTNLDIPSILALIKSALNALYTVEVVNAILPSSEELNKFLTGFSEALFAEQQADMSDLAENGDEIPEPSEVVHVLLNDLSDSDAIFAIAQQLLDRGAKGILFTGPPGTSKTWYALKVALKVVDGDEARLERVQFHPSFTYEDFIEGMVSTGSGLDGSPLFEPRTKIFLNFCSKAAEDADNLYIFIIDEFSRGDPSKIFGELLTYIEPDYRDVTFKLPYSEKDMSIPQNVVIFATMNPYDKSVSDIDSAMERRFEIIELLPSVDILRMLLTKAGISNEAMGKIIEFFKTADRLSPHGFGHAYFKGVKEELDLLLLWNHKLKFIFKKMFHFKVDTYSQVRQAYIDIISDENKDKIK
jgi:hypothetical protein